MPAEPPLSVLQPSEERSLKRRGKKPEPGTPHGAPAASRQRLPHLANPAALRDPPGRRGGAEEGRQRVRAPWGVGERFVELGAALRDRQHRPELSAAPAMPGARFSALCCVLGFFLFFVFFSGGGREKPGFLLSPPASISTSAGRGAAGARISRPNPAKRPRGKTSTPPPPPKNKMKLEKAAGRFRWKRAGTEARSHPPYNRMAERHKSYKNP